MDTSSETKSAGAAQDLVRRISGYCRRHEEIVAAYLFGSVARGRQGSLSDIDLAFLLDRRHPRLPQSLPYQSACASDLMHLLGSNAVDLVLLPAPFPLLQHRILRDSHLLYCRDHRQRVAFETKAVQTYLDLQPLYAAYTRRRFTRLGSRRRRTEHSRG